MSFSIEGRTAIVTGAANGIGLAIARHFADRGANVVFADVDEEQLVRELGDDAEQENVRYFAGDLREKLTIANLLSATIDAYERVDILVNASRQIVRSEPLNPDEDGVEQMLGQNLMTALRLCQAVSKRMIRQAEADGGDGAGGSIVNLSSVAARVTHPELMGYSVATAAVEQMTRSMAVALAPHRIRVNAVAFGSLMSASLMATLKEHPEWREGIVARTPLGRIAAAAELVETAHYLACDASSFVTGQVLTVDGGRSLLDPTGVAAH